MKLDVSGVPSQPPCRYAFFMEEFPSELSPYFSTLEEIFAFMSKETNFDVDAVNGQVILIVAPKGRNAKERVSIQMAREAKRQTEVSNWSRQISNIEFPNPWDLEEDFVMKF